MSVMPQCYYIIIDRGISETLNGKELVHGLNAIDKCYIYQLIYNIQLSGSKIFDSQMQMQTITQNNDVSLTKKTQKHLSKYNRKNGVIGQVTQKSCKQKKMDRQRVSCSG